MSMSKALTLSLVPLLLFGKGVSQDKELAEVSVVEPGSIKLVSIKRGNSSFDFDYKNRTEAFYSRSANLFSSSSLDQAFYAQTTNDFNFSANIENSALKSGLSMRNKSRWGNPNATAKTASVPVKVANSGRPPTSPSI